MEWQLRDMLPLKYDGASGQRRLRCAAEIEVAQQVKMSMQFEPPVIVRADA